MSVSEPSLIGSSLNPPKFFCDCTAFYSVEQIPLQIDQEKQMEIEGECGSKIFIKPGSNIDFGRGLGFPFDDRTVSRRHISFQHCISDEKDPRVYFEVLGKNPIWVFSSSRSDGIRVFRNSGKGEMRVGDSFCVSAKRPSLFTLKRSGLEEEEEKENRGSKKEVGRERISVEEETTGSIQSGDGFPDEDLGFGSLDVSDMDPVKEFGFMVLGHEFDKYSKKIIRNIKDWDWFLEETRKDSEDEEVIDRTKSRGKKHLMRKKKDEDNNDEDWTGESGDEKLQIAKLRSGKRPRYSRCRSKDVNRPLEDTGNSKISVQNKIFHSNKDADEEGNLGDFIVSDEELEEVDDYDEEEEDFDDNDDDDGNGEEELED